MHITPLARPDTTLLLDGAMNNDGTSIFARSIPVANRSNSPSNPIESQAQPKCPRRQQIK